jgi:hypothetical protein
VKEAFPGIQIVLGELDDSSVLEEAAAKADIIIRTSSQRHTRDSNQSLPALQILLMHPITMARRRPLPKD